MSTTEAQTLSDSNGAALTQQQPSQETIVVVEQEKFNTSSTPSSLSDKPKGPPGPDLSAILTGKKLAVVFVSMVSERSTQWKWIDLFNLKVATQVHKTNFFSFFYVSWYIFDNL